MPLKKSFFVSMSLFILIIISLSSCRKKADEEFVESCAASNFTGTWKSSYEAFRITSDCVFTYYKDNTTWAAGVQGSIKTLASYGTSYYVFFQSSVNAAGENPWQNYSVGKFYALRLDNLNTSVTPNTVTGKLPYPTSTQYFQFTSVNEAINYLVQGYNNNADGEYYSSGPNGIFSKQ